MVYWVLRGVEFGLVDVCFGNLCGVFFFGFWELSCFGKIVWVLRRFWVGFFYVLDFRFF